MKQHHASVKPDWEFVAPEQRASWQRVAARTNGIVTPGNVLSITGLILLTIGLIFVSFGDYWWGFALILSGRALDVADGFVAELTGTKSLLGQAIDATIDKIVIFASLIVLVWLQVVPPLVGVMIAGLNVLSLVASAIARKRKLPFQPSLFGKLATAGYWVTIAAFLAARLTAVYSNVFSVTAYALVLVSLTLGMQAQVGYMSLATRFIPYRNRLKRSFIRFVVIQNPASTDAHRTAERVSELQQLFPRGELVVVKMHRGETGSSLLRQLSDKLGPQTLLCVAAGDGTVSSIIDELLHDPTLEAAARRTPVLPLWCGNANDLAYMLSGRPTRRPVHKVFRRGHIIPIYPLECRLLLPDGETIQHTAASYASFGASAYATRVLEAVFRSKSFFRRNPFTRIVQELLVGIWALTRSRTFSIEERSQTTRIFERTLINGSRFAKIFGIAHELTDKSFHRVVIAQKHPLSVAPHIFGLFRRRDVARHAITHDAFTVIEDTWAQFDGEAKLLPGGTRVEVSLAPEPFYAVSTRLRLKRGHRPPASFKR